MKDYERLSFVTGEKQETASPTLLTLLASTPANATQGHPDEAVGADVSMTPGEFSNQLGAKDCQTELFSSWFSSIDLEGITTRITQESEAFFSRKMTKEQ